MRLVPPPPPEDPDKPHQHDLKSRKKVTKQVEGTWHEYEFLDCQTPGCRHSIMKIDGEEV